MPIYNANVEVLRILFSYTGNEHQGSEEDQRIE